MHKFKEGDIVTFPENLEMIRYGLKGKGVVLKNYTDPENVLHLRLLDDNDNFIGFAKVESRICKKNK